MHALLDRAYQEKRRREEQRLREEAEQERRRREQNLSERRQAQSKLIDELERQAAAWLRARFPRRYVLAAHHALAGHRIEVKLHNQSTDFLDWAATYVDQLDPLSPTPHNPTNNASARFIGKRKRSRSRTCCSAYLVAMVNCHGNSNLRYQATATMNPQTKTNWNSRMTEPCDWRSVSVDCCSQQAAISAWAYGRT